MKICVIAEGCYPYVTGGVSSWLHEFIQQMPEHEFIIWAIGAQEKNRGKYAYTLPDNVSRVVEVYLDTVLSMPMPRPKRRRYSSKEREAIKQLILCAEPDWSVLFRLFRGKKTSAVSFLLDDMFLDLLKEICAEKFPSVPFTDFFWTSRSMFLPMLYLLCGEAPEADIYHSVSTGYAGVLASMASELYDKPLVITEHGIYTREREEEIIRSTWVQPQFKDMWINMFYMYTRFAYTQADVITSLFSSASKTQHEIGAELEKLLVVPNGVHIERFKDIPLKLDNGFVDIGAVVRVVPIKDIKTMLYAYSQVLEFVPNARLHIIGPYDEDEEYYDECLAIKRELGLENAVFTGRQNVAQYMVNIDFLLLTSISEGMPLVILEGYSAHRPIVTTNVGSCRELVEGPPEDIGPGGICVPAMHQHAIAEAMIRLCTEKELRLQMGENGYRRVSALYLHEDMMKKYRDAYAIAENKHADRSN